MQLENRAAEVERWLQSIVPLEAISTEQFDGLMNQCHNGSPLHGLIGLMLGARQDMLELLANTPLGTAEKSAAAAVIQGTAKGIDEIRQTLLRLAKQAAEKEPATQTRTN